jgi:hypothetical protein
MNPVQDCLELLQSIESAVVRAWRENPAVTSHNVRRAYAAAIEHYGAIARQRQPKPAKLTGTEAALFEKVKRACDSNLEQRRPPKQAESAALPAEDLVACLRQLRKSADLWPEEAGWPDHPLFTAKRP